MGRAREVVAKVFMVAGPGVTMGDDCCVYLLDGGSALVLVDAGADPAAASIIENMEGAGYEPGRVASIVVTHGHIDHVGGLAALQEATGAAVVAHRQELPAVEQGVSQLTADYLYGLRYRPVKVDLVLEGRQGQLAAGELVLNWVHTPGHTAGSICLYVDLDGCRVLFGQDIHGPFNRSWGSDLAQWRQSMERLLALQADVLCEGHYGVISPAAEVERFIRRHLNLHR